MKFVGIVLKEKMCCSGFPFVFEGAWPQGESSHTFSQDYDNYPQFCLTYLLLSAQLFENEKFSFEDWSTKSTNGFDECPITQQLASGKRHDS